MGLGFPVIAILDLVRRGVKPSTYKRETARTWTVYIIQPSCLLFVRSIIFLIIQKSWGIIGTKLRLTPPPRPHPSPHPRHANSPHTLPHPLRHTPTKPLHPPRHRPHQQLPHTSIPQLPPNIYTLPAQPVRRLQTHRQQFFRGAVSTLVLVGTAEEDFNVREEEVDEEEELQNGRGDDAVKEGGILFWLAMLEGWV